MTTVLMSALANNIQSYVLFKSVFHGKYRHPCVHLTLLVKTFSLTWLIHNLSQWLWQRGRREGKEIQNERVWLRARLANADYSNLHFIYIPPPFKNESRFWWHTSITIPKCNTLKKKRKKERKKKKKTPRVRPIRERH